MKKPKKPTIEELRARLARLEALLDECEDDGDRWELVEKHEAVRAQILAIEWAPMLSSPYWPILL